MREKLRTAFAERLVEARKLAGISQPQLAKLAGVSQGTIGEAETTAIGSKHTAKLATVLGVRAEWLSTGEGPMVEAVTWPFRTVTLERVMALSPEDRRYVEGKLESAIESCELATTHPSEQQTDRPVAGRKAPLGRLPGEVLRTGRAKGAVREVEVGKPAGIPNKRSRRGA